MHIRPLQLVSLFLFAAFASASQPQYDRMAIDTSNCHCDIREPLCIAGLGGPTCDPTHRVELTLVDPSTGNSTSYPEFTVHEGCQQLSGGPHLSKTGQGFCIDFPGARATFKLDNEDKERCLQRVAKAPLTLCNKPECYQTFWIDCSAVLCTRTS